MLPSGGAKQVLIVNGFDRNDRSLNPRQTLAGADNTVDRVRLRGSNTMDYVVQVATAIHRPRRASHISSTSNEAVISGAVNLADYSSVIWILGEESTCRTTRSTPPSKRRSNSSSPAAGTCLSPVRKSAGTSINSNNGRTFYETTLKGNYVADDANTYSVTGSADTIFCGTEFLVRQRRAVLRLRVRRCDQPAGGCADGA